MKDPRSQQPSAQRQPKMTQMQLAARQWYYAALADRLGDTLTRLDRMRLRSIRDEAKRERVRGLLIESRLNRMPERQRKEVSAAIILAMPRRLRRALGDRPTSGTRGLMVVPHESAKRDRNVRRALARGDAGAFHNFMFRYRHAR